MHLYILRRPRDMAIFIFIFFVLLCAYAYLINFYRRAWKKIPVQIISPEFQPQTKVSLIIPARNEQDNLPVLLESISRLDYPSELLEVIIIDDNSTDNTWQLISDHSFVRGIRLSDVSTEELKAHKKFAIEKGIESATGELIVTTDADCHFHSGWLKAIAQLYQSTKATFIAAPVSLRAGNNILSIFQSLDFMTLQGITGATVYEKFHTMCNGANLAYQRSAFYEVGGFKGIDNIPSGDDMFLMYKIFRRDPSKVHYLKSREAIVVTEPVKTWKEFFNQRIRWASKASHYEDKKVFRVLLLVYILNGCYVLLAIAAFWKATWFFFLVLLLIAKILIEFPFVNVIAHFFDQSRIMKYFPFMQPLHIAYTVVAGWLGKFGSYEWKGRRIKQ